MQAIRFLTSNAPWLGAGALLTFSSCFGQTFFISVFAGEIRSEFNLSHGEWGGIYTLGTLGSAVLMLWAGTLTDRIRVRHLGSAILALMVVVCLAMAINSAAWALPLIVLGLRFSGQGMMGHVAVVAMGRWFRANRGKAVALASTGYLIGESLLPFVVVLLIGAIGWRMTWGIAAILPLVAIPMLVAMLRTERNPRSADSEETLFPGMNGMNWTRSMALKHWLFWAVAPAFLCPPIFGTALFFQQVHLTETKGWELSAFVALIPLYVAASTCAIYGAGWVIDRIGAARVLSVCLVPLVVGFVIFARGETLLSAALGFMSLGLMSGSFAALSGTFWAEFYGTRHLGAIRAVATSLMVFGSAIGPGVTGYLIDFGIIFEDQMIGIALIGLVSGLLAAGAMVKAAPLITSQEMSVS